jgi:hypothetical protein
MTRALFAAFEFCFLAEARERKSLPNGNFHFWPGDIESGLLSKLGEGGRGTAWQQELVKARVRRRFRRKCHYRKLASQRG